MKTIDFEVKLFDTTQLAADGSNIPRRSCEAYIQSPDYQVIIKDKVSIGGVTHKDRKLRPEYKGLIGMDDLVLINNNATHYITELYFKPGDNFFYASARTFDPALFAGDRQVNIQNLIGMLETGVRMPISVVIQALWSKRGTAERIIRIKGFDFTQNPSFKGAGDIQFFSEVVDDNEIFSSDEELKTFSASIESGELILQTRVFSSDGTVTILDDDDNRQFSNTSEGLFDKLFTEDRKTVTYSDIISMYGQNSPQARAIQQLQGRDVDLDQLKTIAAQSDPVDPELDYWYQKLNKNLVDDNDQQALQILFRGNKDKLINILHSVPKDEPNREQLIQYRLDQFFRVNPETQVFSNLDTMTQRIRNFEFPRIVRFNNVIRSYQNYVKLYKDKDKAKLDIIGLFIQDIELLIKDVLPQLKEGKTLNQMYTLTKYGNDVKTASDELSLIYRKVLISRKVLGFTPKMVYSKWKDSLFNFYSVLVNYVFGEPLDESHKVIINLE